MSDQKVSAAYKQRIIEESFGWLKEYTVSEIDGKKMMTAKGETIPFNVADTIQEDDFIKGWLTFFALGNHHGKNYFPMQDWMDISADGLQSVMVVDAAGKPVLIIPPLVSNNLGPEQYRMFRHIEAAIKQISADTMRQADPMASAGLVEASENSLAKVQPRTVTDLISPWYYAKHDIVPEVEQQIYYIRDNINNGNVSAADLTAARPILYKAYRNQPVSNEEKDLINRLVKNQWDIDFGTGAEKSVPDQQGNNPPAPQEEYNPLEC